MTQGKTLARNTALIALSKLTSQFAMLFMLPLYTSLLTTEEYGTVDLIITYGSLFAPLVMLNLEMAVFRHLVDARGDDDAKSLIITNAMEIVAASTLVAAILFFAVSLIFEVPLAAAAGLYFFASSAGSMISQVVRGLGDTKAYAVTSIAQGLLSVLLNVLFLVVLGMGPTGMLLGLSLGTLLPAIVLSAFVGLQKNVRRIFRDKIVKKDLLRYSLPLIPNSISWWVFNASDRTIVSIIISTAANGIYAVSNKFSGVLNSLWGIFYLSWSESASININKPNRDSFFSEIANTAIKAFGALAIAGTALTPIAFPFLANDSYGEALLYVPILMLAGLFSIIVGFYSAIYVAKKLTKQVMNTSVLAAIINIVVHLGLIHLVGLWAAAISTAVAYLVMAIYRHYDMKKYVKITYEKGIFVKIISIFAIVSALYYLNNIWANIAGLVIALAAGLALNYPLINKLLSGGKLWVTLRRSTRKK